MQVSAMNSYIECEGVDWIYLILYDIYLLQLGFHPVAVVGILVHKNW